MTEDCTICAEKYNKSNHKCIGCEYCDFKACQTCVKTYLLDKPEPKCMNSACDRQWTRKFISANFTATFINKEFRPHLSTVQFELEKSLLPSSQITLELENRVSSMLEEERRLKAILEETRAKLTDISLEKDHLKSRIYRRYHGEEDTPNANEKSERSKFMRACPANDCRGYLSTQWKCGLCTKYTCPDCHEIRADADHTCDPSMLASAQAIAKDSKNCPNCSALIFRIEGCNHMFCTACHTGFDWKTGKLIRGSVGNPHYFEYMASRAENNRQPTPNTHDCMDIMFSLRRLGTLTRTKMPIITTAITEIIEAKCDTKPNLSISELISWIHTCVRHISHTEDVLLVETLSESNEFEAMEHFRVKYLRNQIDDSQFRMSIQKQTQKSAMKREYRDIVVMANQATRDIVTRIISTLSPSLESFYTYTSIDSSLRRLATSPQYMNDICDAFLTAMAIYNEMDGLCEYVNAQFKSVVKTYHSTADPYEMSNSAGISRNYPKATR
jgi:hypothetical protein